MCLYNISESFEKNIYYYLKKMLTNEMKCIIITIVSWNKEVKQITDKSKWKNNTVITQTQRIAGKKIIGII